jgi:F-type H+-transporting ATPase subunit gamma
MSNLKTLKTRLKSVESTRKITSAMYMVAAAKFRKAQKKLDAAKTYAQGLNNILHKLPSELFAASDSPLLSTNLNGITLIVLFASDRGLCGGFNAFLLKKTQLYLRDLTSQKKPFKLICIGQKAIEFGKKHYSKSLLDTEINTSLNNLTPHSVHNLLTAIYAQFNTSAARKCVLMFNAYTSPLTQTPSPLTILPLEHSQAAEPTQPQTHLSIPEFLPSESEFLDRFIYQYIYGIFWSCYTQTVVGEYAARMSAMDSSTNNCNDMIHTLKLEYNQQRQNKITKELIEIISGAEALQKG